MMEDLAKFAEPYLIENQNYFCTELRSRIMNTQMNRLEKRYCERKVM